MNSQGRTLAESDGANMALEQGHVQSPTKYDSFRNSGFISIYAKPFAHSLENSSDGHNWSIQNGFFTFAEGKLSTACTQGHFRQHNFILLMAEIRSQL